MNAYQNLLQQNQQQLQHVANGTNIIWIQGGIEGAKSYPVPAGNSVALWDSEANTIYVKMVDMAGIPQPIRIFDYSERTLQQTQSQEFITLGQLNTILEQKFEDFANKQNKRQRQYNNNRKGGKQYGKPTV